MNTEKVTRPLVYLTDSFLDSYRSEFEGKYLALYKAEDTEQLQKIFDIKNTSRLLDSSSVFEYLELFNSDEPESLFKNIKRIRKSLGFLTISQAENEKLWTGLSNTYYLDYHIYMLNQARQDTGLKTRAYFTYNNKRSLMLNTLSSLWWIGYYTYDSENSEDPFHLTEFVVNNASRGDMLMLFSSNITSSFNTRMGTIEAIKYLSEKSDLKINRYAYSNSNKILNQVGGVKILDMLSREEIRGIIVDNLLYTDKIRFKK